MNVADAYLDLFDAEPVYVLVFLIELVQQTAWRSEAQRCLHFWQEWVIEDCLK